MKVSLAFTTSKQTGTTGGALLRVFWMPLVRVLNWPNDAGPEIEMGLMELMRRIFGQPHPKPHRFINEPDLTPEEMRRRATEELEDVWRRVELLKQQVDVQGRRG